MLFKRIRKLENKINELQVDTDQRIINLEWQLVKCDNSIEILNKKIKKEKPEEIKILKPKKRRNLKIKKLLKNIELKEDFYTPNELAKIVGVHNSTIIRMINDGRIKAKKTNNRYIILKKDLI